ncbi:MAG: hypothetical protein EOM11_09060, partial [Erysipelotrichia bacterium]|nr:hypothetical protein [Erysipelotrichia bacterium]
HTPITFIIILPHLTSFLSYYKHIYNKRQCRCVYSLP